MKKFLTYLIVFAVTLYAVQSGVYLGIAQLMNDHSQFRFARYFRRPSHDVFILGNSRGANSVSERFAKDSLGVDALNLSYNGQTYPYLLALVKDICSHNQHATLYVEISALPNSWEDDNYASYMHNSRFFRGQYAGTVYNWLLLTRLDNEFLLRDINNFFKSDDNWINKNTITQAVLKQEMASRDTVSLFPDKELMASRLDTLQQVCHANHNKLIYFLAPYFPLYRARIRDLDSVADFIQGKYDFVNLNSVPLSWDMFEDRLHTNTKAVGRLTDTLLKAGERPAL